MKAQHLEADRSAADTELRRSVGSTSSALSRRRQRGASAIEYGLIIALIGISIIGGITVIGDGLDDALRRIAAAIS